jgi:hypothetical protein
MLLLRQLSDLLDLALAEQGCGPNRSYAERASAHDVDADRFGEPLGFFDARVSRASRSFARQLGYGDDRAFAARDLDRAIAIE